MPQVATVEIDIAQNVVCVRDADSNRTWTTHQSEQPKDVLLLSSLRVVAGDAVRGKLNELHQVCDVIHEPSVHEGTAQAKALAEQIRYQSANVVDRIGCILRHGVCIQ